MKLLLKQKIFSWFDSFDVYGEDGNVAYKVKGELSWGKKLKIYTPQGDEVGEVNQKIIAITPSFDIYERGQKIGSINKKLFKLFGSAYNMESLGWTATGNFTEWDYEIKDSHGNRVAKIGKKLFNLTDTYALDIADPKNALYALMFVIAVDAEKASRKDD